MDQSDENVADLTPKKKARVAQLALKARIRSRTFDFQISKNQSFHPVRFVTFAAIPLSFHSYLTQTTAFHCKRCKIYFLTNKIHETANYNLFFEIFIKIHRFNVMNLLTFFLFANGYDEGLLRAYTNL